MGTVSRVLNGFSNITPINSDRVKKAIEELGYEKCRSAEMLVARRRGSRVRSGNIGAVFFGMGSGWAHHPLVASYTLGVERACAEKGFHALIELSADDDKLPRCVRENKVDGLLIKTSRNIPKILEMLPPDMPLVGVGFNEPSSAIQQVAPDNCGAGWIVAEYLWKLGHRRIAFLCYDIQHPVLLARLQGYESYLRRCKGYAPELIAFGEPEGVTVQPSETPPKMDSLLDRIWAVSSRPTAIIAANDWEACGLYSAIARRGLRIPHDLSVVGFDNDASVCNACVPPLTSYEAPFSEVAYRAAIKLLEQIDRPDHRPDPSIHLVRGNLVERASVQKLMLPEPANGLSSSILG